MAICHQDNKGKHELNSLWPSDAIWRQGSRSTLVQVMACCLTAPSHYLNQCWLIITKVQRCSSEGNFAWDITGISHWKSLKIIFSNILLKFPRGQSVNYIVAQLFIHYIDHHHYNHLLPWLTWLLVTTPKRNELYYSITDCNWFLDDYNGKCALLSNASSNVCYHQHLTLRNLLT